MNTAEAKVPQRLWEIGDELAQIGAEISENGGELTPELEARLNALEGSFFEKVTKCALLARERGTLADGAAAEKDRLAAIEKADRRTADNLMAYINGCMAAAGIDKVDTARARVRRYKSGTPSMHFIGDLADLPERLVKVVPEARSFNKSEAAAMLKAGEELPTGVRAEYSHYVRIL